ncbi:MAG: methyltransferase family protein [Elusimicrobiota bacterium]
MTLAYVLVAIVMLAELPTLGQRRPGSRSGDRGSYVWVMLLMSAGYYSAFYVAGRAAGDPAFRAGLSPLFFGRWSAWAGTILAVGGTVFRQWAIRTLGRFFTRSVRVSSDQPVVQDGPYRWVRHPSYTGSILAAAGIGLALGNALSLACLAVAFLAGFGYRIHVEEAALVEALGEPYREYRSRTKRLIPFVW